MQIRNIEQERQEYEAVKQMACDSYVEWYQTVGYCETDKIRKDYIIEYYSSLSQRSISFGVSKEDYENFIRVLNEEYKDG